MITGRYVLDMECDGCGFKAQYRGETIGIAKWLARKDAWVLRRHFNRHFCCVCKNCRDKRGAWPREMAHQ